MTKARNEDREWLVQAGFLEVINVSVPAALWTASLLFGAATGSVRFKNNLHHDKFKNPSSCDPRSLIQQGTYFFWKQLIRNWELVDIQSAPSSCCAASADICLSHHFLNI